MAPHSPTMSHIPHYGTPGYSQNPTSLPPPQSPLALALRRNLPAQGPQPAPDSPLLKATAAARTPQDSPSLKSINGHNTNNGTKIKVTNVTVSSHVARPC